MGALKIVALGGGHGLYATLTAMRYLSRDVTAVVTVADDGGSSGRMRAELDVIPPGDLRMALAALMSAPAALADRAEGPDRDRRALWADAFQHRFGGRGALAGHPVGNLLLAGLSELLGDPVAALDELIEVFDVDGRVLPMSLVPLDIEAIEASVKKTGRCVIVHEAPKTSGFGGELSALVQERCFYHLEAPIARVTGWDTPYPHAQEWAYFPGPARVGAALQRAVEA